MVLGSENPTGEEPYWKRWFGLRLLVFRKALRRGHLPQESRGTSTSLEAWGRKQKLR